MQGTASAFPSTAAQATAGRTTVQNPPHKHPKLPRWAAARQIARENPLRILPIPLSAGSYALPEERVLGPFPPQAPPQNAAPSNRQIAVPNPGAKCECRSALARSGKETRPAEGLCPWRVQADGKSSVQLQVFASSGPAACPQKSTFPHSVALAAPAGVGLGQGVTVKQPRRNHSSEEPTHEQQSHPPDNAPHAADRR